MIKLRPVLKNLGINQIVSIDDDYENDVNEELKNQEILYYEKLVGLSSAEKDYLYDSGFQLVDELFEDKEETGQKILDKIITYSKTEQNKKTSPLIWLENTISEIGSQTLNYIKLSNSVKIDTINKENTLWILDKDMKGTDSIFKSISRIKNNFENQINIFAIYTHDYLLEELNQEWEKRFDYLVGMGFPEEIARNLAFEFYVICKPINPKMPEKTVFKKVVLGSIIGHTINSVFNEMKNAKTNVLNQFEEFTKKVTFERLSTFRYNVENEGEHNIYKLMNNVMNLMELQNYQELMMKDVNYINAFKKVISNTERKNQNEERLETLKLINEEYLWNKYQYIDSDINLGFEDIQFGDTFEIELSDFYKKKFDLLESKVIGVIISQSCDCIVRKDTGKRKKSMIEVLLFEEKQGIDSPSCDNLFNNGIFLFNNKDNKPSSYILNNSSIGMICIDDAILDLTSLNINGEAVILEDNILIKEIELKKPIVWNEKSFMYENLKMERIIGSEIDEKLIDVKVRLLEARYGIKYLDDKQMFSLKRIGRLIYNNAHTILNNYISNISRIGKESPNTVSFQDVHTI